MFPAMATENDQLPNSFQSLIDSVREQAEENVRRIRAKAEKQALILFSLEGNSQEETGVLLGCSANAVETRVYRVKKLLKEYFQNPRQKTI
jgi:DNA-directed RNA polymerase specialized sigma24 family protein